MPTAQPWKLPCSHSVDQPGGPNLSTDARGRTRLSANKSGDDDDDDDHHHHHHHQEPIYCRYLPYIRPMFLGFLF